MNEKTINELQKLISHYHKRLEFLKDEDLSIHYTHPVSMQENSVPIRNPREIEYIRWSNCLAGLEQALDIINKYEADKEVEE